METSRAGIRVLWISCGSPARRIMDLCCCHIRWRWGDTCTTSPTPRPRYRWRRVQLGRGSRPAGIRTVSTRRDLAGIADRTGHYGVVPRWLAMKPSAGCCTRLTWRTVSTSPSLRDRVRWQRNCLRHRITVGRRIGSAALVADGHTPVRTDSPRWRCCRVPQVWRSAGAGRPRWGC
jgi:hypothetical protein